MEMSRLETTEALFKVNVYISHWTIIYNNIV